MPPGQRAPRLGPESRREQLLAVGIELFSERAYPEVEISDIAGRAGVSRGLLYRYFTDKADLFAAVVRSELDGMAQATRRPADGDSADPQARVRAGLDTYFDYICARPHWYRALYRGAGGVAPEIRTLVERSYQGQAEQILEMLGIGSPDAEQRMAVRCWIAFLAAAGLALVDGTVESRDALRDRCAAVLFAAVDPVPRSMTAAPEEAGR